MSRVVRPHTKSRRGCHCCKRRRVKCDLVEPRCGNCVRLGMTCTFEGPPPMEGAPKVAIPRIQPASSSRNAQSQDLTTLRSVAHPLYRGQDMEDYMSESFERRLFSYYIRQGEAEGQGANIFMHQYLGALIPTLSFEFRFLMEVLLSICAASFRLHKLGDKNELIRMSHILTSQALAGQAAEIASGIQPRNFEAIYIASILIAVNTVVQHQFVPANMETAEGLGTCIAQWLLAFRGVRNVVIASGRVFVQSRLAAAFPAGGWQNPSAANAVLQGDGSVFNFLLDEVGNDQSESYVAYQHAVAYLYTLYQNPSRQASMRFLTQVQPAFVASVEAGEPIALVLMAVYFALSQLAGRAAVIDKSANRDLKAIRQHLSRHHSELLERALAIIRAHPLWQDSGSPQTSGDETERISGTDMS